VTGATGFLGRAVASRLVETGALVTGTSRRPQEQRTHRWACTGLDSAAQVDELVTETDPDVVIHLAGHVGAASDPSLVGPTFDSLLVSAVGFLDALERGRLQRLVLIGSFEEPAAGRAPASPYGAAKAAATTYARLYARWGADVVVVRPAMVFGHGQAAGKVLPYVARSALSGTAPELASGARLADWVYVDDVVEGLLLAAERAPAGSEVDLGTGVLTSTRDVVEALVAALDVGVRPRWGALPDRLEESFRPADVSGAEQLLGWRPRHTLQDGIRESARRWAAEAAR
jgi:nucleoside-diphosphate-sugar epimerase